MSRQGELPSSYDSIAANPKRIQPEKKLKNCTAEIFALGPSSINVSKIGQKISFWLIWRLLDEVKNVIHLLQMDVRTGREAPMTFFVVPLEWAESLSGWSQSPAVQMVAPQEHKPGWFVANGTMQSIRPDPADPFSTSHCHVRLFRCYWAHVTELTRPACRFNRGCHQSL